jgi:hypothetical protein
LHNDEEGLTMGDPWQDEGFGGGDDADGDDWDDGKESLEVDLEEELGEADELDDEAWEEDEDEE